ncbi:MAG: hypothetical protein PF505_10925 [Vallitaleaceae bacterium]|jgi:hypothetical protein|nr:hypothetical protein [Vallitaleaceae bacterium]
MKTSKESMDPTLTELEKSKVKLTRGEKKLRRKKRRFRKRILFGVLILIIAFLLSFFLGYQYGGGGEGTGDGVTENGFLDSLFSKSPDSSTDSKNTPTNEVDTNDLVDATPEIIIDNTDIFYAGTEVTLEALRLELDTNKVTQVKLIDRGAIYAPYNDVENLLKELGISYSESNY